MSEIAAVMLQRQRSDIGSEGVSFRRHRLHYHSEKRSLAPEGGQGAPLQQWLCSSSACPGKKALEGAGSQGAGCAITLRSAHRCEKLRSAHLRNRWRCSSSVRPGKEALEGATIWGRPLCPHPEEGWLVPEGGKRAPLQSLCSSSVCPGKKALEGAGSQDDGCAITLRSARWRRRGAPRCHRWWCPAPAAPWR